MKQRPVPILMYHQVTPRPHPVFEKYSVTPAAFAAQMRWLKVAGYHSVDMDQLLDCRRGLRALPARPIIITFDDGYQDCADHAVPLLRARGFTAVFYLVSGLVGKASSWLLPERGIEFPLFDWQTARTLETEGFQMGSHTVDHPHLVDLSIPDCRHELTEARHALEGQLGHPVRHLAYPHGSFNDAVRAVAVETGYSSACSTRIGISPRDDDPLALARVPVLGHDSLVDFVWRLHTSWSLEEWLRRKATGAARQSLGRRATTPA